MSNSRHPPWTPTYALIADLSSTRLAGTDAGTEPGRGSGLLAFALL